MEKFIRKFNVDVADFQPVVESILEEMEKGLSGRPSSLAMIPSYTDIPSGQESGTYLAIDFGGTNLRCLVFKLLANKIIDQNSRSRLLDAATPTGEELFSSITDFIISFLGENASLVGQASTSSPIYTGFTFSFPVSQTSISEGTLIRWTKEFRADGVVGYDVVKLLSDQLVKRGYSHVKINALCNDTVGTLCAASSSYKDALIGVIQGTGGNACYRERTANVTKLKDVSQLGKNMIINMEWGGLDIFPSTAEDDAVHHLTRKLGAQRFEKMTSGKYLPMICRVALRRCIENGWVLEELCGDSPNWDPLELLTPIDIENIQFDDTSDLVAAREFILKYSSVGGVSNTTTSSASSSSSSSSLPTKWVANPADLAKISLHDAQLIRALFTNVITRSARYTAVAIAAVVVRILNNVQSVPTISVAIDGSIYHKQKGYKEEMQRALDRCLASLASLIGGSVPKVTCVPAQDGSGVGAGIISAVQANAVNKK